jgi:hypothetical protein
MVARAFVLVLAFRILHKIIEENDNTSKLNGYVLCHGTPHCFVWVWRDFVDTYGPTMASYPAKL